MAAVTQPHHLILFFIIYYFFEPLPKLLAFDYLVYILLLATLKFEYSAVPFFNDSNQSKEQS